jgi:SPP1 gp7 family putative phage head morphogenesis protein
MAERIRVLPGIRDTPEDYEAMEAEIRALFRREIYLPLAKDLGAGPDLILRNVLITNGLNVVLSALRSGRITFDNGKFYGKFTAAISRDLRELGARFNKVSETWDLRLDKMPVDLRVGISGSEQRFNRVLDKIVARLQQILPEEIADRFKGKKLFDTALWRLDRKIDKSIRGITVSPQLTQAGREAIAEEYTNNMRLHIRTFADDATKKLRSQIETNAYLGNRYDAVSKMIQRSYQTSEHKAKFLARQETSILMAKFKKARYTDAGLPEYNWGCVNMPHDTSPTQNTLGNVRYSHGILEGKRFRWDNPPITTEPGRPVRRNNPGEDYGCRCFARPIVRFR